MCLGQYLIRYLYLSTVVVVMLKVRRLHTRRFHMHSPHVMTLELLALTYWHSGAYTCGRFSITNNVTSSLFYKFTYRVNAYSKDVLQGGLEKFLLHESDFCVSH